MPTFPCPPWGSTGLCIGGVWADWTTPDWLMESERDWMAVSDTVVQILGEPCLLSLLRSSTWKKDDRGGMTNCTVNGTTAGLWRVVLR